MDTIVLTYKEAGDSSPAISVCAYGFKWANLDGAEILGGDPYFIAEAVKRGAVKPAAKAVKRGRSQE